MKRRFFLFAAPAIVAAPSLMRVSALFAPAQPLIITTIAPDATTSLSFADILQTTLRNRTAYLAEQIMRNNAILQHLSANSLIAPPITPLSSILRARHA